MTTLAEKVVELENQNADLTNMLVRQTKENRMLLERIERLRKRKPSGYLMRQRGEKHWELTESLAQMRKAKRVLGSDLIVRNFYGRVV